MADYLVTTDFKAHDLVSPALKAMSASNDRFARHTQRTFKDVFKGSFLGTLGAQALTRGVSVIHSGVTEVVDEYKDFDTQINAAAVKFGGIEYGSEKFKELGAVAREVGRTTKFTAGDSAGALEEMAGAGIEVVNAMKLLAPMANFAAAAKMNLAEGVEAAGGALNAFAMNSKDATIQTKNLETISDVLAKTDASTRASVHGLSETVSWAAGRFTGAGQSLQTFSAIAGGLADVMIDGSVAGTVMRNMIKGLTSIGPKGKAAIKELGLTIKGDIVDQKGNLNNVIDILAKMEEPFAKLGTAQKAQVLTDIFGERAVSGVTALLNKGISSVKELESTLYVAQGASKKMGDQLNQSLTFRIMALQNALLEKGFQIFEKFLTNGRGGIEDMITAIDKWDIDPIADALSEVAKGLTFAVNHIDDIIRLGKAFVFVKGAMMAIDAVKWIGQLRGAMAGMSAASSFFMPLSKAFTARSDIPMVNPMAGGSTILPGMGMPVAPVKSQYTGRYDNWGKALPTTIKSPKVTLEGALNATFSLAAAAYIGKQIGDAIRENWVEPDIEKAFKNREKLDTEIINVGHQIRTGQISTEEAQKQIEKQKEALKENVGFWDMGIGTLATFFGGGESPVEAMMRQAADIKKQEKALQGLKIKEGAEQLFTPNFPTESWDMPVNQGLEDYKNKIKNNMEQLEKIRNEDIRKYNIEEAWGGHIGKGTEALDAFEERQRSINSLYDEYAKQLEKLNEATREAAVSAGVAQVSIEVSGEGAERVKTSTKSTGPRAPKVDVSRAGAN